MKLQPGKASGIPLQTLKAATWAVPSKAMGRGLFKASGAHPTYQCAQNKESSDIILEL